MDDLGHPLTGEAVVIGHLLQRLTSKHPSHYRLIPRSGTLTTHDTR